MSVDTAVAPIQRSAVVNCSIEQAFRTFTEGIGSWWPLHTHSVAVMNDGSGAPETAIMEPREGGRLYERGHDGREASWGTVLVWEPPARVVIAWHVNPDAQAPTEIEVRFTAQDPGSTIVELEHRGWERLGALAAEGREGYANGWPIVFGLYVEAANAA